MSGGAAVESEARPGDAFVGLVGAEVLGVIRYLPEGTHWQRLVVSEDRPDVWMIVGTDGAEVRPARLWVVTRGRRAPVSLTEWIEGNFPTVLGAQRFGLVGVQLRLAAT